MTKSNLEEKSSFSDHSKWKFSKYEIPKFSISFLKNTLKQSELYKQILKIELKLYN